MFCEMIVTFSRFEMIVTFSRFSRYLLILLQILLNNLSHDMIKPTKSVCAQRRLRSAWASAQSDHSLLLCAQWVAKDPSFLHADSDDSDQTGWMPSLIWVFARRTVILLVLSCRGSSTIMILNFRTGRSGKQRRPLKEQSDQSLPCSTSFGCLTQWLSHIVQILGWLQQIYRVFEFLGFLW